MTSTWDRNLSDRSRAIEHWEKMGGVILKAPRKVGFQAGEEDDVSTQGRGASKSGKRSDEDAPASGGN